ncbi:hypothetical protein [Paenibacillus aquistagni]|uniref:hypothetical protein n=1 Tax=Paenibacillus aquistagni TaxID=1852522 RepID=UPI00145A6F05|nr:hypothetical protein [Paenibacillus aquistagni]NMM52528.1 hypothetical protein [Paenibacillus aquistagni]
MKKIRWMLVMSLFITLILLEINRMPYKDPIELYQSRVGAATQLDLDTMATYEWNSYQISFLKDSLKNTHLFFVGPDRTIDLYLLDRGGVPERDLYWQVNTKQRNEQRMVLFCAILFEDSINLITLRSVGGLDMKEELKTLEYNNTRYVIAISDRIQINPVDITGYSQNHDIVYKNVNAAEEN